MKVIVISGGGRRVGKTTLATRLVELLPNSQTVKLGTHPARAENPILFLQRDTSFKEVVKSVGNPDFLVIESGAILDDPDLDAELVIFLPTQDGRKNKPGSDRRRKKAHMVRGETISQDKAQGLPSCLGVELDIFENLAELAGVPIEG